MKILDNKFILIFLLLISIAYPLYFTAFGIDFTDTFFHFNNVTNYGETGNFNSSMTFLSTFFLFNWGRLFGHTVLNYRILNVMLCVLILLLPFFYFRKQLNHKIYFILVLISSIAYVSLLKSLIGYDSISDFFILNSFFSLVLYINQQGRIYLVSASFFIALATATRIPDILLVVFSIAVFLISFLLKLKSLKEVVYDSITVLFFTLLFYSIIVLAVFDSFSEYWELLTVKNLNQTYSVSGLIGKYLFSLLFVLKVLAVVGIAIVLMSYNIKNHFQNKVKNTICLGSLFLFFIFKVGGSSYFTALSWTFTALFIIIFFCLLRSESITKTDKVIVIMSLFFSFLPALGSNTGLLKANVVFYILFLVSYYNFKERKIILAVFFVVFFFGLHERFQNTYDDRPYSELNATFNSPFLKDIRSSKTRANGVNEVEILSKRIVENNNQVIFYGMNSHVYNTVTSIKSTLSKSFDRSFYNKNEIAVFDKYLLNNDNVFFIVTNKYVWGEGENFENSDFKKLMTKYNYKRANFGEYMVFEPILIK